MRRIFPLALAIAACSSSPDTLPEPPNEVVVFANPAFVDFLVSTNPNFAEGPNLIASFRSRGLSTDTFYGFGADDFAAAVDKKEILAIPELEVGDLNAVLTPEARSAISSFVSGGGVLFLFMTNAGTRDVELLNAVFSFALVEGIGAAQYDVNPADVAGTPFAGGPAALPDLSATGTVTQASLPAGSRRLYVTAGGDSALTQIPFGAGHVVIFGWDWFNAPPVGTAVDGGWLDVLANGARGL